jgi:hypothetical protein
VARRPRAASGQHLLSPSAGKGRVGRGARQWAKEKGSPREVERSPPVPALRLDSLGVRGTKTVGPMANESIGEPGAHTQGLPIWILANSLTVVA